MVCGNHLKIKYVRFLIKYHLFIFVWILIMSSACLSYLLTKHHQFDPKHLLRGFQAHGTELSDDYRKFLALLRETQTSHLYPHSMNIKLPSQTPYPNYQAESNPCSKRYYHSSCPIFPYVELVFQFHQNESNLFQNSSTLKNICVFERNLRVSYSSCSTNTTTPFCCQVIGPVGLLVNETCEDIDDNQYEIYLNEWKTCQSSCSNKDLEHYLHSSLSTARRFSIYLAVENNWPKLFHLYEYLTDAFDQADLSFVAIHIKDGEEENVLFLYLLGKNLHLILISIICYLLCLMIFVKNFFLIFTILLHFVLSTSSTLIIYRLFFDLPWTILNVTSVVLYMIILLIDSFLWYACWFNNNHRRDDCPIQRIIENLLTQAFFYLMPKNLTAIIALVITYTNQIIALQCFTVLSLLLITLSFAISFIVYPVSFVCILRYQSWIPTLEHISLRCLHNASACLINRTIPYLIVRLKALWLTLLTLLFVLALTIVFQWPKLEFDACRMTFDSLPNRFSSVRSIHSMKTFDLDITYYIGSNWEMPSEPLIPLRDIPILDYNSETKMSATPDEIGTFIYALRTNLTEFIHFCASWQHWIHKREMKYKHYHRHISPELLMTERNISSASSLQDTSNPTEHLTISSFPCFADLSRYPMEFSSISQAKFSPIIHGHDHALRSSPSYANCSLHNNETVDESIHCLNHLLYLSSPNDDLFLIKNGLRFVADAQNPRYLFQTIRYRWNVKTNLNQFVEWKDLMHRLRTNFIARFFTKTFTNLKVWWSSEWFATFALMEQLQKEKYFLITLKFLIILVFLTLFTGVLGIFVTLTTLFNFFTCLATLTLFKYSMTVENLSYFVIVLIISSQYSVLYCISYKLAPAFFFQRENRTMYSLQQLCTTLFHVTFSILLIFSPCLFSSLPYLFKTAVVYVISALISLIYSTLFLQSLLCLIGPAGHSCCLTPCRLILTPNFTLHIRRSPKKDRSLRSASTSSAAPANPNSGGTRRHRHLSHPRMSTSSYFASSYFSQIFTSSTYFESEYGGLNDPLTIVSRRRESSRSHQPSHAIKRSSLLTGELIELYTPRASLAPHAHNHRYSRQTSVPRAGVPTSSNLARPLYVSPSISPYSQLSIHSQIPSRQRSPSPHVFPPSRSPSPRSFALRPPLTTQMTSPSSLRPCYSAPRLHVPLHRMHTTMATMNIQEKTTSFVEETPKERPVQSNRKTVMIMQRQDAIISSDEIEPMLDTSPPRLTAEIRRNLLKTTTSDSGGPVWLKRSSSS